MEMRSVIKRIWTERGRLWMRRMRGRRERRLRGIMRMCSGRMMKDELALADKMGRWWLGSWRKGQVGVEICWMRVFWVSRSSVGDSGLK